jgi:cytochrome oxidase assembly protein ShyY1
MGRIRPPEAARNDAGLPAGQVQRIVPAQVATLTGRPTYGGFVDLVTESPSSADAPRILLTPDQLLSEDWWKPPHLAYAVQWFIFVLIACGGWVILGRREILNERELARADNSKVPQEH